MDVNQFKQVVKDELAGVEAGLRTHISDQVAQEMRKSGEDIATIKTDLAKLQARGESPTADSVKELETKLVAAEETIRTIALQLNAVAIASAPKNAEERDNKLFVGAFIKDAKALREAVHSFHHDPASTRAIDSSLFASGGKLSAETADRFIDYVIEEQVALSRVTTRRMLSPDGKTDELTIARRQLRKAVEGVAPKVMDAIGIRRRVLSTVEVIWPEDITLTFLEDNIERAGAETHIARLLATQFGNDLNDLAWNGQEDSGSADDPFESINDGWIELAENDTDVNDVDASGLSTPSNADIFSAMYRSMGYRYLARTDLAFFMGVPYAAKYAEEVSTRETAMGDSVLVNGFPALRYFGVQVIPEPALIGRNEDKGLLTPLPNLYHGIQRQVTVDSEWVPRKRVVEYTITARDDFQYATGAAIVLVSGIPAGNR